MAGHRKATARPQRQPAGARARQRLSTAATAEEQLAAAYDLFRSAVRHLPASPERRRWLREASQFLARLAAQIGES